MDSSEFSEHVLCLFESRFARVFVCLDKSDSDSEFVVMFIIMIFIILLFLV